MAKAMSVCTVAGCPVLTQGGRCKGCQADARAKRRGAARSGYGSRWAATRKAFLRENPYCQCGECLALSAILRPVATEVDHIDGLGPLGPRGYDWTNLRSMTKAHHARETARNQPGGWNDRG